MLGFIASLIGASMCMVSSWSAQDQDLCVVRGRCIDAESGDPIKGCRIEFRGRASNSHVMNLHGPVDWKNPDDVITDATGTFEFSIVPPVPYQFSLNVECENRVPRTARWGYSDIANGHDFGDISMQLGYVIKGRVVDSEDRPVKGVGVVFQDLPIPIEDGMAANNSRSGLSDENGQFTIQAPIPEGTWNIDIPHGRGYILVGPHKVTVEGPKNLTVLVRPMPGIRGRVIDENGEGVKRVYLAAELGRAGKMASAWTRSDGSFVIHKIKDVPDKVRIEVMDPGPCEPKTFNTLYSWDAEDVVIQLIRAAQLSLQVVERGSRVPIEEYSVKCHLEDANSSRFTEARLGGAHELGRLSVDKVYRGKNQIQVIPKDPKFRVEHPHRFVVDDSEIDSITIEVERMKSYWITIVDQNGEPAPDLRIQVVDRVQGSDLDFVDDPRSGSFISSTSPLAVVLSSGATDEKGRAEVFIPSTLENLFFRITDENAVWGPPRASFQVTDHLDPERSELELELGT